MLEVNIRHVDPKRVAAIRHTGPYQEIGACFQRIMGWAFSKGCIGPETRILALYYDHPAEVPAAELRSAACVTAGQGFTGDPAAGVEAIDVEGGDYGVATFKGPYDQLELAYDWLFGQWLPQSGREPSDRPCVEVYLNNPQDTKPEDLLTEIYLPLA